jgi:hypothetical protein
MISTEHVNKIFERGWWVIERQTDGVTHTESLLQPEFRANCMNWVLGHLLFERQIVLEMLGIEAVAPKEITERYAFDSEPITTDSEGVIELPELLGYLKESGRLMAEGFASLDENSWVSPVNEKGTPMWERMEFLAWHEGYHVGQLELLRQLAGKDDKVI